jgi:hypothetical protein
VDLLPDKQKEALLSKSLEELKALKTKGVNSRVTGSHGNKPYEQYGHIFDQMLVHPDMDNSIGMKNLESDQVYKSALAKV